jgi:hypothetical protein
MGLAGYVERMGGMRNAQKLLVGRSEEKIKEYMGLQYQSGL